MKLEELKQKLIKGEILGWATIGTTNVYHLSKDVVIPNNKIVELLKDKRFIRLTNMDTPKCGVVKIKKEYENITDI